MWIRKKLKLLGFLFIFGLSSVIASCMGGEFGNTSDTSNPSGKKITGKPFSEDTQAGAGNITQPVETNITNNAPGTIPITSVPVATAPLNENAVAPETEPESANTQQDLTEEISSPASPLEETGAPEAQTTQENTTEDLTTPISEGETPLPGAETTDSNVDELSITAPSPLPDVEKEEAETTTNIPVGNDEVDPNIEFPPTPPSDKGGIETPPDVPIGNDGTDSVTSPESSSEKTVCYNPGFMTQPLKDLQKQTAEDLQKYLTENGEAFQVISGQDFAKHVQQETTGPYNSVLFETPNLIIQGNVDLEKETGMPTVRTVRSTGNIYLFGGFNGHPTIETQFFALGLYIIKGDAFNGAAQIATHFHTTGATVDFSVSAGQSVQIADRAIAVNKHTTLSSKFVFIGRSGLGTLQDPGYEGNTALHGLLTIDAQYVIATQLREDIQLFHYKKGASLASPVEHLVIASDMVNKDTVPLVLFADGSHGNFGAYRTTSFSLGGKGSLFSETFPTPTSDIGDYYYLCLRDSTHTVEGSGSNTGGWNLSFPPGPPPFP